MKLKSKLKVGRKDENNLVIFSIRNGSRNT
jgi:hypothetical protein